jgi:hypothetical protein
MGTPCDKITYPDRPRAVKELRRMQRTIRRGRIPIRVYWCDEHRGFHLTSKPKHKRSLAWLIRTTTFSRRYRQWPTA